MRQRSPTGRIRPFRVGNPYKAIMSVMLICPKCQGNTELRGTLDAWYLTWCPECERLWRLELWSLFNPDEAERKLPSIARKRPY